MKIRRVGTLLILFAGGILHAGVWHWYGACGHYWHQTCVVGTCGSQNQYNLVANNWGQVVCNGTPPFPGPADTVVLQPGDSVILESDVELQRLIIQEGATLVWRGNLTVHEVVENHGHLVYAEGYYNRTFSGTLHNYGTFTQTTGTLTLDSASTLINHPGATLNLQQGTLRTNDSSSTLQNSGLLLKSSTNTFYLHSPLRLQQAPPGSLLVHEGTLYLYGSLSGPVYVDAGAALHLRGAHLSDTTRIAGPGTLFLEGDLVSTSDSITLTTSIDSTRWTCNLSLGSGSQWLNYGRLFFTERYYNRTFSGTFHNYGTFTQTTGTLTLDSASTLINHPGATLELRLGSLYAQDSSGTLQNSGLLLKSSTNTFYLHSPLRLQQAPPGSLLVHEGTLYLYGSLSGPVYVDAGAALHLRGAHLSDTTRIAGPGTLFLEGDLVSTSDSLTFIASIDSIRWTSSFSLGPGSQWLNYGHLVYAENYFYRTFSGTLHNYGTLTQTTGNLTLDSASTLINHPGATLDLQNGTLQGPQDGFADLVNQGTAYKTRIYTSHLHRLHISQEGSWFVQEGTLDFGTSTTFSQPQGRTVVTSLVQGSQPLSLLHGSLQGSGTLRAPVLLTGDTLSPGDSSGHTAALTFQHSLVMEPTAVYRVEIAGTEFSDTVHAYDRLVVNASSGDSVALHTPTLQVVLLPGYTPCATPDSFAILTWNSNTSFSGSFGTLQLVNAAPSANAWLAVHGRALYLYLMDTEALLGDVNNDGEVNALDVDDLANYLYFHGPPVPGCADLNRDSRIDDKDLVALTRLLWPRGTAK